jgi:hypothetical protein
VNIELKEENLLLITWSPDKTADEARDGDGLMYLVYFPEKHEAVFDIGTHKRKDGQVEILISQDMINQRMEVQIAFKSIHTHAVSTSQYAGGFSFDKQVNADTVQEMKEGYTYCTPLSIGNSLITAKGLIK